MKCFITFAIPMSFPISWVTDQFVTASMTMRIGFLRGPAERLLVHVLLLLRVFGEGQRGAKSVLGPEENRDWTGGCLPPADSADDPVRPARIRQRYPGMN